MRHMCLFLLLLTLPLFSNTIVITCVVVESNLLILATNMDSKDWKLKKSYRNKNIMDMDPKAKKVNMIHNVFV